MTAEVTSAMCNGYRLNRILDALAVLISENEDPKSPRTQKDRRMLDRLLDLHEATDKAAIRAQTS